jgi:hypothetical protein
MIIDVQRKKPLVLGRKVINVVLGEVAVNDPMRKLKFILHNDVIYFLNYLFSNNSDLIE